ncbi:MAG: carboxypeptidase regulatory-like domain-containing protein [Anaerolineae bacterium]|nr:carboxypeptidase regulatory-like domain-containing protein [Anaerolineae bacterium]
MKARANRMMAMLLLIASIVAGMLLVLVVTAVHGQGLTVGTVSHVQLNGRRVEGLVSVGGYSVTVTLKDPQGVVKASQTTWPDANLRWGVMLTATIRPSDTVEVTAGDVTTAIFVVPMTARLDPLHDRLTGTGPANQTLAVELWRGYSHYTATASVDGAGMYTVTTFYQYGTPVTVDIQPGDYGTLRYSRADGNQVYLYFGLSIVYVHENHNRVYGYAGLNGVPVSVTLYGPDGDVKAACSTTSYDWGAGWYQVNFDTSGCWGWGDPVIIRGGDTVVVEVEGVSTAVPVPLLTATPNLATDTVSGVGPPTSTLKVSLNCGNPQWVTTNEAGIYATEVFTYLDYARWPPTVRTCDIVAGSNGQVEYTDPDFNIIYINYAATGVPTTIAAGGLRAGARAVLGTAMPGARVEIWDVTDNRLIGVGTADADGRFAISVNPPLIYGHTIVAIANGLPSVGHVVQRAVTINGPATSVTNTVGLYGIAPANSTVEVYESGILTVVVTTTASASGYWSAVAILANGVHTLTARAVEPDQISDPIVVVVDPTLVSIGSSTGTVGGQTYQSDASGRNHFQIIGGVQPITITVEVLNNPCTVTITFMGRTVIATPGDTPNSYTAVFTDYEWSWGTHEAVVTAISCGGTPVSQKVADITLIDPSGYVYDAITGARIQGATVTCYYSDTEKNEWVIWEAALYNNQLNPQSTDAEGRYGFMVPPGQYYVTASKPGYADNRTEVYTIPPEVTDANIPLTPLAGRPATVTLTADPTSIPVGGATSLLRAQVEDEYGRAVADGTVVTFTTSLGSVGSTVVTKTTAGGVATATLTSGNVVGTAIVTATADSVFDTAIVIFTPGSLHHFTFDLIGTQIIRVPFTITITARDAYGNVVSTFTHTASLTDTTATISPTLTGNFNNGVWKGTVQIARAASGVIITATYGSISGASAPFDVSERRVYLPLVMKGHLGGR